MHHSRIGVDLDETLSQTFGPCLEYIRTKTGIPHGYDDLSDHNFWEIPGIPLTKEAALGFFAEFDRDHDPDHASILPVHGSVEAIGELKRRGYELHVITARGDNVRELTRLWISKHFPETFADVHFTNHYSSDEKKKPKSEVCRALGIGLMIEDNIDYALELADNGVRTILLERPWNRHRSESHAFVRKVKGWQEALLEIRNA